MKRRLHYKDAGVRLSNGRTTCYGCKHRQIFEMANPKRTWAMFCHRMFLALIVEDTFDETWKAAKKIVCDHRACL